jgi:hypothetical protein
MYNAIRDNKTFESYLQADILPLLLKGFFNKSYLILPIESYHAVHQRFLPRSLSLTPLLPHPTYLTSKYLDPYSIYSNPRSATPPQRGGAYYKQHPP